MWDIEAGLGTAPPFTLPASEVGGYRYSLHLISGEAGCGETATAFPRTQLGSVRTGF